MNSYSEFVSNVLGLLDSFGLLQPIEYFLLFVLAVAGMSVLVRMLRG